MKTINIHLKRIVSIISIIILFIMFWSFLRFILVDDTKSFTRLTFHEFYEQDNIDVLFLGASHCQNGYDLEIVDKEFKSNSFNLSSSNQTIDSTYFLLKLALDKYDINEVYIDLSYNISTIGLRSEKSMTKTYLITDYLKPSIDLYSFLFSKSNEDNYANSFLIARRNSDKIFDSIYIKELVNRKLSDNYKNYSYISEKGIKYKGKGSVAVDKTITQKDLFENENAEGRLVIEKIDDDWEYYVREIIKLCKEKGIKLTFVSSPITKLRLSMYEDYDMFIDYVNNIIAKENSEVKYINFNLMKEEYWSDTNDLFSDDSHMNINGIKKYTSIFCDYFNGKITNEELLYSSIKDKYENKESSLYGLMYRINYSDMYDNYVYCTILGNKVDDLYTKVICLNENGEEETIKEWNDTKEFEMLKWYVGKCRIEYAEKMNPEDIRVIELDAKGFY